MTEPLRAGLLARVSSGSQAGEDRMSMPAQIREMTRFCEREGWVVAAVFEAAGESAYTEVLARRPVMLAALEAAERGEFDVMVVHESSRFARNLELARAMRRRLKAANVRLVAIDSPSLDDASAEGKLFSSLSDGMNEYWSDKISEHTKKAKREAFARGLHLGDPPFGYRRAGRGLPLEVVAEEAEAVSEAFRDYAAGAGYTEIMERWNLRGLRPRSKQGNTQFTMSAMQSLLENPFYAGWVTYKGERQRGAHVAIIEDELYVAAQTRVRRRSSPGRQYRLLSGLASCAHCRGPIWIQISGQRLPYYYDAAGRRGRECAAAAARKWRAEPVEAEVERVFAAMAVPGSWLERVERASRVVPTVDSRAEQKAIEAAKRRLTVAYLEGALEEGEWRQRSRALEVRLGSLPVSPLAEVLGRAEQLMGIGQVWGVMSTEERREACRLVFEAVEVDMIGRQVGVRPWAEFRGLFEAQREVVASRCVGLPPPGFEPSWDTRLVIPARELWAA